MPHRCIRGAQVGLLGLQFETRRRNRANGVIASAFALTQSFGNCAKYIQTREQLHGVHAGEPAVAAHGGARLPDAAIALIRRADTFFIAADDRAGLLFIDFEHGGLLQLSGRAETVWDGPDVERIAGAKRVMRFRTERHVFRPGAMPLRWTLKEQSPHLDATGVWE